jgi:hypothetical protein
MTTTRTAAITRVITRKATADKTTTNNGQQQQ